MGTTLANLDVNLRGSTDSLDKAFSKSEKTIDKWKNSVTKKMGEADKSIAGGNSSNLLASKASGVLNAFESMGFAVGGMSTAAVVAIGAVAVTIGALVASIKSGLEGINNLAKTALLFNTSVEAIAGLQHAAVASGVSVEDLDHRLAHLQNGISSAAQGGGELGAVFNQLGLQAQILNELPIEEQFAQISEALKNTGTQADKVRVAMQLFGRGGAEMLPLLMQGKDGLAHFREEAIALGLAVTGPQADAVRSISRSWAQFGEAMSGIGRTLAVLAAPALEAIVNVIKDVAVWTAKTVADSGPWWNTFVDLLSSASKACLDFQLVFTSLGSAIAGSKAALAALAPSFNDLGITWQGTTNLIRDGMLILTFAFDNMKNVLSLLLDYLTLKVVKFGNDFLHYFTDVIPTVLKQYQTLIDGIKNGDLGAGFDKAVENIKKSLERPATALENSLAQNVNAKTDKLLLDLSKFLSKKIEAFNTTVRPAAVTPDQGSGLVGESKKPKALEAGSAEAFSVIAGTLKDKMFAVQNAQLQENKKMRAGIEKLVKDLTGKKLVIAKAGL